MPGSGQGNEGNEKGNEKGKGKQLMEVMDEVKGITGMFFEEFKVIAKRSTLIHTMIRSET